MKYVALAMAAGLMAVSCASAFAMGTRPVESGADVIPRAEYDAVAAQYATFTSCLTQAQFTGAKASGDLVKIDLALTTMGSITGARMGGGGASRAQFNAEKAIFDAELIRLKTKYGC